MGNIEASRRRTALLKKAPGNGVVPEAIAKMLAEADFRCTYCGTQSAAMGTDHAIPLSRGGAHDISNIVPCCRSCNSKKGDKTPEEFAAYRAGTWAPPKPTASTAEDRTMSIEALVTPPEAAGMLGIRRSSVYHIADAGRLTRHRIGDRVFFERAAVERLANETCGKPKRGRPRKSNGANDGR